MISKLASLKRYAPAKLKNLPIYHDTKSFILENTTGGFYGILKESGLLDVGKKVAGDFIKVVKKSAIFEKRVKQAEYEKVKEEKKNADFERKSIKEEVKYATKGKEQVKTAQFTNVDTLSKKEVEEKIAEYEKLPEKDKKLLTIFRTYAKDVVKEIAEFRKGFTNVKVENIPELKGVTKNLKELEILTKDILNVNKKATKEDIDRFFKLSSTVEDMMKKFEKKAKTDKTYQKVAEFINKKNKVTLDKIWDVNDKLRKEVKKQTKVTVAGFKNWAKQNAELVSTMPIVEDMFEYLTHGLTGDLGGIIKEAVGFDSYKQMWVKTFGITKKLVKGVFNLPSKITTGFTKYGSKLLGKSFGLLKKGVFGISKTLTKQTKVLDKDLKGVTKATYRVAKEVDENEPSLIGDLIKDYLLVRLFQGKFGKLLAKIPLFGKIFTKIGEKFGAKVATKEGVKVATKTTEKVATKETAKVGEKVLLKEGVKVGEKVLLKEGVKVGEKSLGKSVLKKIPLLGALAGGYFALDKFTKGDIVGGLGELASGLVSQIPYVGIPASLGIDSWLAYRDIKKAGKPQKPEEVTFSKKSTGKKEKTPVFKTKEDFVKYLYPKAKQVEQQTGIPADFIVSQAALETGWGKKVLPGTNNLFNIKAGKNWKGEAKQFKVAEYINGQKVYMPQKFRAYSSPEESLMDYANFLTKNKRYSQFITPEYTGNVSKFASAMQYAGYATDPNYASKIVSISKRVKAMITPNMEVGAGAVESKVVSPELKSKRDVYKPTQAITLDNIISRLNDSLVTMTKLAANLRGGTSRLQASDLKDPNSRISDFPVLVDDLGIILASSGLV